MITLIIVKNPFSPQDGREVKYLEEYSTLAELKKEYDMPGVDLLSTVNGYSIEGDKELKDGDFVILYPAIEKGGGKGGGKGILGIIAAVVLSVVSFGIGGLVATGVWGSFAGASALAAMGGYFAAAAIMFLGSSLIGRMTGQHVDTGSFGQNTDEATYSWTGVQTMEGQNNPIALTYGLVKSGGQTIGKYTTMSGNDDYLCWLVAAGEGELSIFDIRLNNNPINLFKGVNYQTRSGTNDQSIIEYFGDTYYTAPLSYNLALDTWYTSNAQGTATQGLIIKIECPSGLYYVKDNGDMVSNYVKVKIEVRNMDAGSWVDYLGEQKISSSSNKAVRREYRIDRLPAGEYSVRVKLTEIEHSEAGRSGYYTYWTGLSSIVYDDFMYPCTALIGIKAKATDQLSGSPSLSFKKQRTYVYVWNPYANTYQQEDANNPAWACYDIIHQCRRLKNVNTNSYQYEVRGAPKELMRYDDFSAWAKYCDQLQYYVNIEIISAGELLDVINSKVAPTGHGRVLRFGTKYGCIYAHRHTPVVQMFGMGNIVAGSFREEFMKVADRANCVEVTYTNRDNDYERDVITVYGETYNSDGYAKPAQITMDGITDYRRAYREGVYQLQCNKYQLRTVTFEANIDSIACTVGDVVKISHDVPRWQNSGRIESVDSEYDNIVLPCELPNDPTKGYLLQWRAAETDTMYECGSTVISVENGFTTVHMVGGSTYPSAGDVFSIAEGNTEDKLYTITNITRAQDFSRTISCLEYNEDVFREPANYWTHRLNLHYYARDHISNYGRVTDITDAIENDLLYGLVEPDASYAFYNCQNLKSLRYAEDTWCTVNVTNMRSMFENCTEIELDVRYFDTSNVINMQNTFNTCYYTKKINVRRWDVSKVQNMQGMFGTCTSLTSLDLSTWNTVNVTNMSGMFNWCVDLVYLDVSGFNTSKVTDMSYMLYECDSLLQLDLTHWDTSKVTDMSEMFAGLGVQTSWSSDRERPKFSLDLSTFDTSRVTDMGGMFYYMGNCTALDISNFDTVGRNVNMSYMFTEDNEWGEIAPTEYLIIGSNTYKFELYSGNRLNHTCKILVPRALINTYLSKSCWAEHAEQFEAIEDYVIERSGGQVKVTPR